MGGLENNEWLRRIGAVVASPVAYSKTSLNRPTMRLTLNGSFREVVGLGSYNIIVWAINCHSKATGIGNGSGRSVEVVD